jgi:hypothetical protein
MKGFIQRDHFTALLSVSLRSHIPFHFRCLYLSKASYELIYLQLCVVFPFHFVFAVAKF